MKYVIIAWHFEFDMINFFYSFCKTLIRLYIERVVWNKRYFWFYLIYRKSVSASQTFLFSHRSALNNIYVMKEYENKKKQDYFFLILFDPIKKKLWDCWITDKSKTKFIINIESNGAIIVFFNSSERKGGNLIIYQSGSDRSYFFSFFQWKVKVNSIIEPYAMHKRCPYGCSILSFFVLFFFFIFLFSSLHHARYEIEESFIMLYHQGNDPSTC